MSKYIREFKRLIFTFLFTEIDEVARARVGYKMLMTTSLLSMYKTIIESKVTSEESYFKSGEGIGEQKRIKIIHTKYLKIRQKSFIWTMKRKNLHSHFLFLFVIKAILILFVTQIIVIDKTLYIE